MTVSDQIIQVLDVLFAKFGLVIDWTSENIIPYLSTLCTKLVAYEIWTSVVWMAIMLALTVASIIATKKLTTVFKNGIANQGRYDYGWTTGSVFAIIGLVMLYIAVISVTVSQTMDIIKCVTFPEMYIFEYIQGVLNSGG